MVRGKTMKNLMNKDDRESKQNNAPGDPNKIKEYRKRISDKEYLDAAIKKIATDLSNYLTK